jgi:DNA-binding transcriptional regulator YhcF (GntR family)
MDNFEESPMSKLPVIAKPESLAKMARDALLNSILSGELNTDEVYNEMALAKDLGISRTPVREALLELSVLGFIQFIPRRGVVVNRFDRQDIDEIFELRKALETAIVEKAARAVPPADLADIEKTLGDQRAAFVCSIISVAVWLKGSPEKIEAARIAMGAVAPTPIRIPAAEAVLAGKKPDEATLADAARSAADHIAPIDDLRSSAAYRKSLAETLTRRLLAACVEDLTA